MTEKWVYAFGAGSAESGGDLKELLGGKGANLAQMCRLGLPVPPGFTITTDACIHYYKNNRFFPGGLKQQVTEALERLGAHRAAKLDDASAPLLLAVRSGARVSMPGMMDTVLNLGLNSRTVAGLGARTDARFAHDCYRRFLQMYGEIVLGLDMEPFDEIFETAKDEAGAASESELDADGLKSICDAFKAEAIRQSGKGFPEDVQEQLWGAIGAVFESWQSPRAQTYRRLNGIPDDWGTAVTVQAMVFGNRGPDSAAGVAFTRDPATGEKVLHGEFLPDAQGEDVVSGLRTPRPLSKALRVSQGGKKPSFEELMPKAFAELEEVASRLENHYRDMQDMEFTLEQGRLFLLQTRTGKRTIRAALKIAVDMVREGMIDKEAALMRVDVAALDQLLHPRLDPDAPREEIAAGLGASPGAATGEVVFSAQEAVALGKENRSVILVRSETRPDDIHGMYAARGVLTARGGMTSHAAVVARGMGRPCVTGAGSLRIDAATGEMSAGGIVIRRGDIVTLDGASGKVFKGAVALRQPDLSEDFAILLEWADQIRTLQIRADVGTPAEAGAARRFGADGIGLYRTEHMMDLGGEADPACLLPQMRGEFSNIFREMAGLPVAIRLFEPPRPLPPARLAQIHGLQLRAILETAGCPAGLDILIPLAGVRAGFEDLAAPLRALAGTLIGAPRFRLGAVLDSPRAAELAGTAECFCLCTDDIGDIVESREEITSFLRAKREGEKRPFGVCGERLTMPLLVRFCHDSGIDYLSCPASHVPVARIIAAQSALSMNTKKP